MATKSPGTFGERKVPTPAEPAEARAIAKEAYIYGFPMVDNYRIQHSYFVDRKNPEYKTSWNTIYNNARVYTPDDKAIQTPNSDTPYSFIGADLRAESLVVTVPPIEKNRYFSLQFIDQYTFNFAYVGSRTTGNHGGAFLLAGPQWTGPTPQGLTSVIRSETEFVLILYRTQLFEPADIEKVKAIQAGYKVERLSTFLGQPAPEAPPIEFLEPLTPEQQRTSLQFFDLLNFVLQFCPTHPSEKEMMERFARIGVGPERAFDLPTLSPEGRKAVEQGMVDAWKEFKEYKETQIDTGKVSSADSFGNRAFMKGRYLDRMSAAVLGIYGNSKDEAFYPGYFVDGQGQQLSGTNRYALRFPPNQLPPVHAFWSLTLYELPASLLSANRLNRYLINSPMLPSLARDPDGGVTLYVQNDSPGKDKESNWLPAPEGPFLLILRLYWPKPEVLDKTWTAPPLQRV